MGKEPRWLSDVRPVKFREFDDSTQHSQGAVELEWKLGENIIRFVTNDFFSSVKAQSRILSHALSRVGTRQLAYMPSLGQNASDENKGASAESAVSHCMHAKGTGVENSSGFRTRGS